MYAAQVVTGFILRTSSSQASATVTFVYILFAVGIARSWELLGLHGGGPLDLLAQHLGQPRASIARIGYPACDRRNPAPREVIAAGPGIGYDAQRAPVPSYHPAAPLLAGR